MKKIRVIILGQALALSLIAPGLASCDSGEMLSVKDAPSTEDVAAGDKEYPEAWHDKMRTMPYPKLDNELVVNPSPLIVPQSLKTKDSIQFELSQDKDFGSSPTSVPTITIGTRASQPVITSKFVRWNMFNPHQVLNAGTWYWRYRLKSRGGEPGEWSAPIEFRVSGTEKQFVTPKYEVFFKNMSTTHPRLHPYMDDKLAAARKKITSIDGYKNMINDADKKVAVDVEAMADPFVDNANGQVWLVSQYLHTAYLLTTGQNNAELKEKNPQYKAKMLSTVRTLLNKPIPSDISDNFKLSNAALSFMPAYDLFYDELTSEERTKIENILYTIINKFFPWSFGVEENHIFDNHFWQKNMRTYLQIAYLLADKPAQYPKVLPIMEYLYELWTARAPAMGYNRDGGWENGTKYFGDNVETLSYVPLLFGKITGFDFFQHPWYDNAGKTMIYTWPPTSKSLGFGDGVEWYATPTRQRVAFADFLARQKGDVYAGWYATQQPKALRNAPELRLYRMCNFDKKVATALPEDMPKMIWLQDMGEVLMHSDLNNAANDFSMSFRSSTFGSGSHTLADQNSFNLLYKGDYVYHNTGYYINFSGKHNLLSYRHTRAHNSILVNGIGQPFSTTGYGDVVRAMGGDHIAYCLGDASHAYNGISEDELWVDAFKKAGIAQTPEYGFGKTPLKKYRRHMLMLYPNILVIYDELEASEATRWDWLLHSDTKFTIDNTAHTLTTSNTAKGFVARTQLFSNDAMSLSQTDQFFCDPDGGITSKYKRQWHMTAQIPNSSSTRVLAIVQVGANEDALLPITQNGNVYTIGDWTIDASMASISTAALKITNSTLPEVSFVYDARTNSSLYDTVSGTMQTQTQTDRTPVMTRGME